MAPFRRITAIGYTVSLVMKLHARATGHAGMEQLPNNCVLVAFFIMKTHTLVIGLRMWTVVKSIVSKHSTLDCMYYFTSKKSNDNQLATSHCNIFFFFFIFIICFCCECTVYTVTVRSCFNLISTKQSNLENNLPITIAFKT